MCVLFLVRRDARSVMSDAHSAKYDVGNTRNIEKDSRIRVLLTDFAAQLLESKALK